MELLFTLEQEATMPFIELGAEGEPLNTYFLLNILEGKKDCPRFYGKTADKITVSEALTNEIHIEVKSKWAELRCHCSHIPVLRISKTSCNLNKVFLTCGAAREATTRCKYFQWIHTELFIDKRPAHKLMYTTEKRETKDAQTQTMSPLAEAVKQFQESIEQKKEQSTLVPWSPWGKKTEEPKTLSQVWGDMSSSEYAKEVKKQKKWADVRSIANHLFHSKVKGWHFLPSADRSVVEYLEKKKNKGEQLSKADEKMLKKCKELKYGEWKPLPGEETYERNPELIAQAIAQDWSFGFLPEKVCSLATFCKNQLKNGLPLTPLQDRFFAQLVNVKHQEKTSESEDRFKRQCDANNAERKKHGMAPYSYDIFRQYGTGIF